MRMQSYLHYDIISLQWRHNGCDSVRNHQPHDCLLNRLFRRRSKKTSKLHVTGLWAGKSPVISPHKGQWCGALTFSLICVWMASNAENVSIWWRHHVPRDITMLNMIQINFEPKNSLLASASLAIYGSIISDYLEKIITMQRGFDSENPCDNIIGCESNIS